MLTLDVGIISGMMWTYDCIVLCVAAQHRTGPQSQSSIGPSPGTCIRRTGTASRSATARVREPLLLLKQREQHGSSPPPLPPLSQPRVRAPVQPLATAAGTHQPPRRAYRRRRRARPLVLGAHRLALRAGRRLLRGHARARAPPPRPPARQLAHNVIPPAVYKTSATRRPFRARTTPCPHAAVWRHTPWSCRPRQLDGIAG